MVLAGDFRQTLPVVPKGTRADEIKACLKFSYLWKFVTKLQLKVNITESASLGRSVICYLLKPTPQHLQWTNHVQSPPPAS